MDNLFLKNEDERFEEFFEKTKNLSKEYGYTQLVVGVGDPVDEENTKFFAQKNGATEGLIESMRILIDWMESNVDE